LFPKYVVFAELKNVSEDQTQTIKPKQIPSMKNKRIFGSLALAGSLLTAAIGISQAAQLGGADLGATAPTAGYYDISQLLTTGDTVQLPDGSLNSFYDNTGSPYVGSSFTTGPDSGGYVMNSLAIKFGGGGSVGYAGGNDTTLNGGWVITLYQLSGTGNTTATPIYTNTVGTLTGSDNTGADWINITGFSSSLLPNTTYAWTIYQPNGYDDLAYATGTPYKSGAICRIAPGGGAVTYFPSDNDSASFNVGLSQIPPTLGGSDLGSTTPSAGPNDVSQLLTTGDTTALPDGNLNDFYDNTTPGQSGGGGYVGSSYTTGPNAGGYVMNGMILKFGGGQPVGYAGGNDVTLSPGWIITTYQLSGTGNTNATPISTNIVGTLTGSGNSGGDWIQLTGFDKPLLGNTTYAWTIYQPGGYDDLGYATGTPYTGGTICRIQPGGGPVTYFSADNDSATFAINLTLLGYPSVGVPLANYNAIYALSPSLVLQDTASGPGALTYQWQTDGGGGGALTNIPAATGLSYTNIPANLNPGGDYTINYDFVVANSAGAVTSSVVAVTVHAATAPVIIQDTSPTNNATTFVGGSLTLSAVFDGTHPITYQWYSNTNSSNQPMPGQTNATLVLSNIQSTAAGTYQLKANNSQGNTYSTATTLSIAANPPDYPPVPSTAYAYEIYTNSPYAYWRLNETGNPAVPPALQAFDYSGHGIYPTYGTAVTTGQPGPQAPSFPGFETTNLAIVTTTGNNGYLAVPPLNMNANNVTFVCWINPSGNVNGATGLLFSRGVVDNAAGFGFNAQDQGAGTMAELGYTWNQNASGTWGWNSHLHPLANVWNFVAYVLTPTNMTAYLGYVDPNANTTNFLQAVNTLAHQTQPLNSLALGADTQQNREFNGTLDEAALFNKALSKAEILKLFETGTGVSIAIAPTPAPLTSESVYSGSQIQLGGVAGGTDPITYQWQAGVTGSGVFTNLASVGNVSGVTSPTLIISSIQTNNDADYRQIAVNSAGSITGNVATVSVTAVPTGGLWTVNFQLTNNVLGFATSTNGLGQYAGAGVLGGGTYWNPIADLAGAFTGGNYTNVSDFEADGATHSGISAVVNGSGDSTAASPGNPTAITTLLDQYVSVNNSSAASGGGLIMQGIPDGTYNMVIYGINGGFESAGAAYTVYAANGNQTASLLNTQDQYFSPGDNSWLFTNVHVTGGTLLTDIGANNGAAEFNGVQLQLVSYDPPVAGFSGTPTSGTAPLQVVFTNTSTGSGSFVWNFGDGHTLTTSSFGNVTNTYTRGGNFTVILTANGNGSYSPNSVTNIAYVSVTSPTPPVINKPVLSGGSLILSGNNGTVGAQYRILNSTNVALPLANWTPVWTNVFASDGSFGYTNSTLTNPASFFLLVSP
jgi:hypothetical protein